MQGLSPNFARVSFIGGRIKGAVDPVVSLEGTTILHKYANAADSLPSSLPHPACKLFLSAKIKNLAASFEGEKDPLPKAQIDFAQSIP